MTTSAPGRSRSAGARTCSTKARNTAVVVGAATVITAASPPRPRAPISVRRRQRPAGRHRASGPLAAPGPGEAARHARVDAALVDEDQPGRVEAAGGDLRAPGVPLLGHVGAVPLGGPERLFLRGQPRRWSARHGADGLHRRPVRAASPSASSASVASPRSASTPSSAARASPPPSSGPAPGGLGGAPALLAGLPPLVVERRHAHREAPGDLGPAPLAPLASDQRPLA